MPLMPNIAVQLVHIQGPFKGQSNEFKDFPIYIGRHSSCQIRFGKEMATISRHHARIECKANRFRIIDSSTNGTFVNGKRVANVYLRDGDVISLSEGGPKISFLSKLGIGNNSSATPGQQPSKTQTSPPPSESMLTFGADREVEVLSTDASLTIEFGSVRQPFMLLPVVIGSDPTCDLVIDDKNIAGHHVQIFVHDQLYYARDLTGKKMVKVNGRPIEKQSVLAQGAELSLTDEGPRFIFHGNGCLTAVKDGKLEPGRNIQSTKQSHSTLD